MAYWSIQHGTDPRRAILGQSASFNDLIHVLLMARGINPDDIANKPARTGDRAPKVPKRAPAPLSVWGGRQTQAMKDAADHWDRANMPKDWATRTGSDPRAIAWLMDPDK